MSPALSIEKHSSLKGPLLTSVHATLINSNVRVYSSLLFLHIFVSLSFISNVIVWACLPQWNCCEIPVEILSHKISNTKFEDTAINERR